MAPPAWQDLVREVPEKGHLVNLYRDGAFPAGAIAAWIGEGLRHGSGAVIVGTPRHLDAIRAGLRAVLDVDPGDLEREGRLEVTEAEATLAQLMVSSRLDATAFHRLAHESIQRTRDASDGEQPVRVWGEMVDLLWKRRNVLAARRLEEYWNEVIHDQDVHVLCTYEVDHLDPEAHAGPLQDICATHTHLVPEADEVKFDAAVSRALVDVFGEDEAATVRRVFASPARRSTVMPPAEAVLMGLHEVSPDLGARVLAATRKHWDA